MSATHYTDRPDNNEKLPVISKEESKHNGGSENHPPRHGKHTKELVDHAIELDDQIEVLKQDKSKETKKGHLDKAHELDKEITECLQERQSLQVPV